MDKIPPGTDLYTIPYGPAPTGRTSDFNKRSDLMTLTIIIVSICLFFMFSVMILRVTSRIGRGFIWRLDDCIALVTCITTSALGAMLTATMQKLGRSVWDVSIGFLIKPWPQQILVTQVILMTISVFLGKLCFLAFYYRIFGHIRHVRYQIYAAMILASPLLAACIVFPILAAPPPGKPWGTENPKNGINAKLAVGTGVVNIVVDLFIAYIPIPPVAGMNLSRRKKTGILAIFFTGSIALIADGVIMYFRVELNKGNDGLRYGAIVSLCSFVEAAISVICSSMPSAAKAWNVHIVDTNLVRSLRSRFGSSGSKIHDGASRENPSDMEGQGPKPKKKRGLYSIGTFPTTNFSVTRLNIDDNCAEKSSVEDSIHMHQFEFDMHSAQRKESDLESDRTLRESNDQSRLLFQDLSHYITEPKPVYEGGRF